MAQTTIARAAEKALAGAPKHAEPIADNRTPRTAGFVKQGSVAPDQRVKMLGIGSGAAAGTVIGQEFIAETVKQGGVLKGLLRLVADLNKEGHTAFQVCIAEERAKANSFWKGRDYTPATATKEEVLAIRPGVKAGSAVDKAAKYGTRSVFTRWSEATTFSKACAEGFTPNFDDEKMGTYPLLIGAAKAWRLAQGKGGGTGPAAKTPAEKLIAMAERMLSQGLLDKRQLHAVARKLAAT